MRIGDPASTSSQPTIQPVSLVPRLSGIQEEISSSTTKVTFGTATSNSNIPKEVSSPSVYVLTSPQLQPSSSPQPSVPLGLGESDKQSGSGSGGLIAGAVVAIVAVALVAVGVVIFTLIIARRWRRGALKVKLRGFDNQLDNPVYTG